MRGVHGLGRGFWMAAVVVGVSAAPALGEDLFRVVVFETGNPANQEVLSGSSVIDLVEAAVESQGVFERFENIAATATVDYAGVANALTVTKNAANTVATLSSNLPGAEFTETFTGANQDELEDRIEDFLKEEGDERVRDFLRAVNARSYVAVSDGNPLATTARMANLTYRRLGFYDEHETPLGDAGDRGLRIRFDGNAGYVNADDFDGFTTQVSSAVDYDFTRRVGLSAGTFFAYTTIEEADVFHVGGYVGVPVRIVLPTRERGWLWQVTPAFVIGGSGSEDYAAGGLILGGSLTSRVAYRFADRWEAALVSQAGFYEGESLTFEDFDIDPGVSQQIIKNGVQVSYRVGGEWRAYGGVSMTNFLDDAAVDDYFSPAVGFQWGRATGTSVQVGYEADLGNEYQAHMVRAALVVAF